MSRFDEHSERILGFVREGLTLTESCERVGASYATCRKWISAGRKVPDGPYGPFVAALDAARSPAADNGVGPVQRQLEELLRGHDDLTGENALRATLARSLAKAIDELSTTRSGQAKMALVSASRRLEETVASIQLPREDLVDELRRRGSQRRGQRPIDAWTPADVEGARRSPPPEAEANGKGDAIEIEKW